MSRLVKLFYNKRNDIFNKTVNKIFFISGRSSFFKTGADKLFENKFEDKQKFLYLKKSYFPNFDELKEIIHLKEKINPDLIIAVGGGCVMDYSKIVSVFKNTLDLKRKIINSDYRKKDKVPLLAIPTTAGSGAEVTSNAVIYINNIKYSVEGPEIRPNYYSLLPKLLLSSSIKIDSSSGFDAISQAMESILSKKSNSESIAYASKALKLLFNNYTDFVKKKNIYNAHKMAIGANLAGKAINISKTTAPHALSYPFTAFFNIPHGHAVSLTLNKFLKFNNRFQNKADSEFNLKKRFDLLFDLSNSKNIYELDRYLTKIKKSAKLEQNFENLGINIKNNYSKIISGLNNQRLKNNPVKITKKDIKTILQNY